MKLPQFGDSVPVGITAGEAAITCAVLVAAAMVGCKIPSRHTIAGVSQDADVGERLRRAKAEWRAMLLSMFGITTMPEQGGSPN